MSQVCPKFHSDLFCHFISGFHCIKHIFCCDIFLFQSCRAKILSQFLFCKADNTGRRRILLKASFVPASAFIRLLIIHTEMTNLTSGAVLPYEDLSVNNDSAAYAGSQCDHDHVLLSGSAAFPHLSQSSNICVISYLCFHSGKLFKLSFNFFVVPTEIGTSIYDSL